MNSGTSFRFDDNLRSAIKLVNLTISPGDVVCSFFFLWRATVGPRRCSTTAALIHYSVSSGFSHHPDKLTESMSSSFLSSTGRRLAGRPVEIYGTVTADAADSGLTLLQCIEAAVAA